MNKILNVKCPQCEFEFNYYNSDYRPFCCEKCKMIDLGHWFQESYTVPSKPNSHEEVQELIEQVEKYQEKHNNEEN